MNPAEVSVRSREKGDSSSGIQVTILDALATTGRCDQVGSRGSDIRIVFMCESCGHAAVMVMMQPLIGMTCVDWCDQADAWGDPSDLDKSADDVSKVIP